MGDEVKKDKKEELVDGKPKEEKVTSEKENPKENNGEKSQPVPTPEQEMLQKEIALLQEKAKLMRGRMEGASKEINEVLKKYGLEIRVVHEIKFVPLKNE